MSNIILCKDFSSADMALVFSVPFTNKTITILTCTSWSFQDTLDFADDYIRCNGLADDVPGYFTDWDYSDAEIQDSVYSPNGGSGPVFDLEIFSNPNTLRLSRADVLSYVSNGEFMQPNIYRGEIFEVFPENGESYYTTEYPEDENPENVERLNGYYAYVSANGYIDMAEVGFFDTEAEAIEALIDYYCE